MRFWIVTPHGRLAPLMGELRPSRESADRLLALGLTDQRRPLYEVLEVELLRAETLESSTHKNEETKAPDMGDWPPSGVGTENSRTEGTSLLEGERQEGTCRQPCQIESRKDLDEAEIQALHRQGGSGSEARHDFPWSSVAAPGLQGATKRDPPPRGAAKSHPVLLGEGRGPDGVLRPTEEQEVELFEGSAQNASSNKGKDLQPELPPGGELLDPLDGSAFTPGEGPSRAGPEGNRAPAAQLEQPTPTKRTGS